MANMAHTPERRRWLARLASLAAAASSFDSFEWFVWVLLPALLEEQRQKRIWKRKKKCT
jgi:hypothetical protein